MSDAPIGEPTPTAPPWQLHHRLGRALEHGGVKVNEMGQILGVSPATMSNYLSGRTSPKAGMMRQWAIRCGVPYEWLQTGETTSTGPNSPGGQGITGTGCYEDSPGQVVELATWRAAEVAEVVELGRAA